MAESFIFDIKRYAINDGPGIRITLFFKGCPLSCVWCHNPEGISFKQEKLYNRKKCIGCGMCVDNCPQQALTLTDTGIVCDNNLCTLCGICSAVCPALAIELSGKKYSVDELIKEIEKETIFMDQSGGGVTFCGGEPLSHPSLLSELLRRCGQLGIHRAVDTTLFAPLKVVEQIMVDTDLFLVDLKLIDSEKHYRYCGVTNEIILSNLRFISEARKEFVIRIPLIEDVNADEDNINRSAEFLSSLPYLPKTINLLPYHDIGKGKHERMGTVYNPQCLSMRTPLNSTIQQCASIFKKWGLEVLTALPDSH